MKMAAIALLLMHSISYPCFKPLASLLRQLTLRRIEPLQELEESIGEATGTDTSIENFQPDDSSVKILGELEDSAAVENFDEINFNEYVPAIFTDNKREFIIFKSPESSENRMGVDESLIDEVKKKIREYTLLYGKKEITYIQLRCTLVHMHNYYIRTNGNVFNEQPLEECFKIVKHWNRKDEAQSLFKPEYRQQRYAQGSQLRKVASSSNLPMVPEDFLESDE